MVTLSAAGSAIGSPTQLETVGPAPAAVLAVISAPQTLVAAHEAVRTSRFSRATTSTGLKGLVT